MGAMMGAMMVGVMVGVMVDAMVCAMVDAMVCAMVDVMVVGVGFDGKPNGIALTSEVIPYGTFPITPNWNSPPFERVFFSNPLQIEFNKQYAIVLTSEGRYATSRGPLGDSYQGGDAFYTDKSYDPVIWVPIGAGVNDLSFETLILLKQ